MTILIYAGAGASPEALARLTAALAAYPIQLVDRHILQAPGWEEKAAALIFPGGRDIPYHKALQGEGNWRIRQYVEGGGRYLGICAGAYYACKSFAFEEGSELEVVATRELAFFPGKAVGPTYGRGVFQYDSEQGAQCAQVSWEGGISSLYFNGGCHFETPESYPGTEILARYHDLPGLPAAALYCQVGQGRALLTGVHPEYSPRDPFWLHVINKILT